MRACLQFLQARGWLAWRQNAGVLVLPGAKRRVVRMGPTGMPDVMALRKVWLSQPAGSFGHAEVLAVECKRHGNKPTAVQLARHAELRKAGALVLTVRDIAELADALK